MGKGLSGMYKDYNPPTDRKIAKRMIRIVYDSLSKEDRPVELNRIDSLFAGDVERYVDFLYDNSIFASRQQFEAFLKDPDIEKLKNDPAYRLNKSVMQSFGRDAKKLSEIAKKYRRGHRLFIAGLLEMQPDRKFYPDANFTMRLTYG
ncbi:hypothetical protein LEA_14762, partial [human gut metagenome]